MPTRSLPFDPRIDLELDEEKKTLTISDTGIGMNEEDLVSHLGTIARSGTKNFLSQLSGDAKKDSNLIGQFGVGFYSAFMVADKVEVISRKAGEDQAWRWTSDGKTGFDIEPAERAVAGTTVLLHFNEEGEQYANSWRLQEIVKKYSNHIAFPIFLTYDKSEWNADGEEVRSRRAPPNRSTPPAPCGAAPRASSRTKTTRNSTSRITGDWEDPLFWFHTQAEGSLEYTTLFYIPVEGAARSLPGRLQGRRQALREARLHHGRRQGASAAVPALRSRHHRQRRPSAQRQPRNPAAEPRAHQHPHRQRQEDSLRAEEHRHQPARAVSASSSPSTTAR